MRKYAEFVALVVLVALGAAVYVALVHNGFDG